MYSWLAQTLVQTTEQKYYVVSCNGAQVRSGWGGKLFNEVDISILHSSKNKHMCYILEWTVHYTVYYTQVCFAKHITTISHGH